REQQREDDRLDRDVGELLGDARDVAQAAPGEQPGLEQRLARGRGGHERASRRASLPVSPPASSGGVSPASEKNASSSVGRCRSASSTTTPSPPSASSARLRSSAPVGAAAPTVRARRSML